MTTQTLLLVGVAVVALLAALGAFAIAWRRSTGATSWRKALSKETLEADRSEKVVVRLRAAGARGDFRRNT